MKKHLSIYILLITHFYLVATDPSSLDTSFGKTNSGVTNLDLALDSTNEAKAIAVQLDGRIITAGYAGSNGSIVRYNNRGTLDLAFINNNSQDSTSAIPGTITLSLGTQSAIYAMAVNPVDNRIIVGGYATFNNSNNIFLARYNPDGSQDLNFGTAGTGYVITSFPNDSQINGIALQSNGRIVIAGYATVNGFRNALIARYLANGILDTTFNTTGYITTLMGSTIFTQAYGVALQTDGKIVVVGQTQVSADSPQETIIARYTSTGSLDTTFNSSSLTPGYILPFSSYVSSIGYSIAIDNIGNIVIAGSTNQTELGFSNQQYTIARFTSHGTPDLNFNNSGYIFSNIGLQAHDVLIQPDQKIVACGFNYTNSYNLIVNRYNTDGSPDTSFNFGPNQADFNAQGNAIALQADGKIVVTGTISSPL